MEDRQDDWQTGDVWSESYEEDIRELHEASNVAAWPFVVLLVAVAVAIVALLVSAR